jgi:hypothetical protein
MMSHVVTCTDMLQGIMTYPAFQFTPDSGGFVFPCLASSVMVLSSAKLIFTFAKFKITESVKELNVLKQSCNPLNVSHSASSKKHLRPVLDWMI